MIEKTQRFKRLFRVVYNYSRKVVYIVIPSGPDLWHSCELSEHCRWWKTRSQAPLSPMSSPPLDVHIYRLGVARMTNLHFPTWLSLAPCIIAIFGQSPLHIRAPLCLYKERYMDVNVLQKPPSFNNQLVSKYPLKHILHSKIVGAYENVFSWNTLLMI